MMDIDTPEEITWFLIKGAMTLVLLGVIIVLGMSILSSGCVTAAKGLVVSAVVPEPTIALPTATPNITPNVTPTPTPTPVPTESLEALMLRTNGHHLRDWVHWFRPDVEGIQDGKDTGDLSTWATIYGYKLLPRYHYHSVSWGTTSFFLEKPDPGMQFAFIFVNIYSDGDDVRQYGFDREHFALAINGSTYYPEDEMNPSYQIKELDETWDFAHVDSVVPYPYKIVQDSGSGIIRAEYQEWIMGGRSNAHDGYIFFQIPAWAKPEDIRVLAGFDNLGGQAWWQLS